MTPYDEMIIANPKLNIIFNLETFSSYFSSKSAFWMYYTMRKMMILLYFEIFISKNREKYHKIVNFSSPSELKRSHNVWDTLAMNLRAANWVIWPSNDEITQFWDF